MRFSTCQDLAQIFLHTPLKLTRSGTETLKTSDTDFITVILDFYVDQVIFLNASIDTSGKITCNFVKWQSLKVMHS